jgi:hypothetical protein
LIYHWKHLIIPKQSRKNELRSILFLSINLFRQFEEAKRPKRDWDVDLGPFTVLPLLFKDDLNEKKKLCLISHFLELLRIIKSGGDFLWPQPKLSVNAWNSCELWDFTYSNLRLLNWPNEAFWLVYLQQRHNRKFVSKPDAWLAYACRLLKAYIDGDIGT